MKTDEEIINLYWDRNESAITETEKSYGKYLLKISDNILFSAEDSKENVNDTYLKAWNNMPPSWPEVLSAFLAKICRNGAIDMYRKKHAGKRVGAAYESCIDELAEVTASTCRAEDEVLLSELTGIIERFVRELDKDKRNVFLGRYFYMDSVSEIALYTGLTTSNVKTVLSRTRKELAAVLEKEGYAL